MSNISLQSWQGIEPVTSHQGVDHHLSRTPGQFIFVFYFYNKSYYIFNHLSYQDLQIIYINFFNKNKIHLSIEGFFAVYYMIHFITFNSISLSLAATPNAMSAKWIIQK